MSSDAEAQLPRTAVPYGITDPVEQARAELKATLAAIEEKANVPRRVSQAVDHRVEEARAVARTNPLAVAAASVAVAAVVGLAVWGFVRAYTR